MSQQDDGAPMSNCKVGILILHGIGIQKEGYSKELQDHVKGLLKEKGHDPDEVALQEVLYSDVFGVQQEERCKYLIRTSHPYQLVSRLIRWVLIHILSDAISYRSHYKKVHQIISDDIERLQDKLQESAPVVVVAHSMGITAISDYIYDQENDLYPGLDLKEFKNLKSFITFGCNIPLFEMGHIETTCIKRPSTDVHDEDFSWHNFYSPFDVLGYRVENYYTTRPEPDFTIHDKQVYAGGIFTKWNLFCHTRYWTNENVNRRIYESISKYL